MCHQASGIAEVLAERVLVHKVKLYHQVGLHLHRLSESLRAHWSLAAEESLLHLERAGAFAAVTPEHAIPRLLLIAQHRWMDHRSQRRSAPPSKPRGESPHLPT